MIDQADDLIETFHALLRISQIEAGARRENFCQVDLVSVLARIEDAYGAVAEENGQSLTFSAPIPPVTVSGDRQLLTQMMANVVENALRHCAGDAQIQVGLEVQNATITFVVCDNGPGTPAEEKEKVLRRFYRLEKSRTTSGNGLGLSLVKAVVDLHDAKNNPDRRQSWPDNLNSVHSLCKGQPLRQSPASRMETLHLGGHFASCPRLSAYPRPEHIRAQSKAKHAGNS